MLKRREKPWFGLTLAMLCFAAPFILPRLVSGVTMMGALYIAAALAFLALSIWHLRHLRVVAELGLKCPSCGAEQVPDLLYKGQCEKCRTWLLHPKELDPWPKSLVTTGSPLRNAIGLVVLFGLTGWMIFKTAQLHRENREDCARRYAAARTTADSSRLDSQKFCRQYRRR